MITRQIDISEHVLCLEPHLERSLQAPMEALSRDHAISWLLYAGGDFAEYTTVLSLKLGGSLVHGRQRLRAIFRQLSNLVPDCYSSARTSLSRASCSRMSPNSRSSRGRRRSKKLWAAYVRHSGRSNPRHSHAPIYAPSYFFYRCLLYHTPYYAPSPSYSPSPFNTSSPFYAP